MEKLIVFLITAAFVVAIVLGVYWLFWQLWMWVLPQIWATGPANLIKPGYWLFCGAFLLVSLVGKSIFGRSAK